MKIIADPLGRENHWLVDGKLVAGPKTKEEAGKVFDVPPSELQYYSFDVRIEAARRLRVLLVARSEDHLTVRMSNMSRTMIRLLYKGEDNWTEQEQSQAQVLQELDDAIEVIRSSSDVLEVMDPIPQDYTDDIHWQK